MPIAERMNAVDLKLRGKSDDVQSEYNKVIEWLQEGEISYAEVDYRREAQEDYSFYSGDQDSAEIKAILEMQDRPSSTFNEVKPKVDMLIGLGAQVKYDGQVIPVGAEDEPLAEIMQGTLTHFRKKNKLGRKELDCFEHMVKSGRSLLYFKIDRSNPLKPLVIPVRVPGYNFIVDPASIEYDMSDAKYMFIWNWVDEDDLKSIDDDIDPAMLSNNNITLEGNPSYYNQLTGKYRIITCWYRQWVKKYWFVNPFTGEQEGLSQKDFKAFVAAAMKGVTNPATGQLFKIDQPPEYSIAYGVAYKYMTFSGIYIVDYGDSPHDSKVAFPAVLYGAYKDDSTNRWFGAVTMMKDPQRSVNTMRRQLVHLLQTLPKGILIHESGTILDIEKYEQKSSEPNFHLEVTPGKINNLKFEKQPQISPVYQMLDEIMRKSMKDSSGIQDDLMGVYTASREPGVTVKTRQESGLAVLFIIFNNFRESRLEGNKKFMYLLQQYVTQPELIRIQGEEGIKLLQINSQVNRQSQGFNDITAGEYDLEMEETVETGSFRAAIAEMLIEFSHNNPNSIPPDIILDYVNIPFSAKQRIKEYWIQQQQLQQQNIEADRAVEMMKIKASIEAKRETKKSESKGGSK
jgi:hypothetical protein